MMMKDDDQVWVQMEATETSLMYELAVELVCLRGAVRTAV